MSHHDIDGFEKGPKLSHHDIEGFEEGPKLIPHDAEWFQEGPKLIPHDDERRQPLVAVFPLLEIDFRRSKKKLFRDYFEKFDEQEKRKKNNPKK